MCAFCVCKPSYFHLTSMSIIEYANKHAAANVHLLNITCYCSISFVIIPLELWKNELRRKSSNYQHSRCSSLPPKIQSFQYRIIHRIIPCNSWLKNITIKNSESFDFCNEIDDIPHFLLLCPNVKAFWKSWAKWRFSIATTDIRHVDNLQKNILFGFVGSNGFKILYSICKILYLYTNLFNQNKLDVCAYLTLLKNTLTIERQISINNNKLDKFEIFSIVYDQL